VVNNTTQVTPTNFQQLIQTTLQYPSGVRFWSPTDGWLYGWLESLSSTNQANIWVKIPSSIPAGGVYQIYMVEDSSLNFDGVYWGEAPQLSSSYAQYDNGANVFNFYDNFKGTTLSSSWTVANSPNYEVNNGFIAEPSAGNAMVYNPSIQETSSIIAEWCLNMSSTSYPGTSTYFQLNRYTPNSNMHWLGVSGDDVLGNNINGINTVNISSSGTQVFGIWNGGTTVTWYYEGNSYTSTSVTAVTDYLTLGWCTGNSYNFPTHYWVRARDYPPNGVMPETAIVPLQAWEVFVPPLL